MTAVNQFQCVRIVTKSKIARRQQIICNYSPIWDAKRFFIFSLSCVRSGIHIFTSAETEFDEWQSRINTHTDLLHAFARTHANIKTHFQRQLGSRSHWFDRIRCLLWQNWEKMRKFSKKKLCKWLFWHLRKSLPLPQSLQWPILCFAVYLHPHPCRWWNALAH